MFHKQAKFVDLFHKIMVQFHDGAVCCMFLFHEPCSLDYDCVSRMMQFFFTAVFHKQANFVDLLHEWSGFMKVRAWSSVAMT